MEIFQDNLKIDLLSDQLSCELEAEFIPLDYLRINFSEIYPCARLLNRTEGIIAITASAPGALYPQVPILTNPKRHFCDLQTYRRSSIARYEVM